MGINSEISKKTADSGRIRFLNYLKALKEDGLIDNFIDLDDRTQSKFKPNEKRGDFLVESEEYKIAIEFKSRIRGDWKDEEEVIKELDTIDRDNAFEQLLKNHYQFKDVGKNAPYRDFIWADPKSANSWKNKRKTEATKQLTKTVDKYREITHCIIVYSHPLLPFNKNGTNFFLTTKWSEYLKKEEVRLFNEVHLPFDICNNFRRCTTQLVIRLQLLENPLLKDSIKIDELLQLIHGTPKEQITVVGLQDTDISEAMFNYNDKLEISNSSVNPLPSEIIRKLTRDEREVKVLKVDDRYFTLFYPREDKNQLETHPIRKILQDPEWLKDPDGKAREEAYKALAEFRKKKNDLG